ncbi:hypothetical protein [Devosia sp.]|uniref:hypothetical protein n=1 Tax=Devosia sp. TaxID=1871048 RepID=UPI001AD02E2B|nr:hypothetical protein [Devosia sp.]MBN9333631.1 hypothetical protein [Devosia sp.]
MSMFATFPYADRIEMLTDGANYTKRGNFILETEKVWRSRHCPMMVTGRGNTKLIGELAAACLLIADEHRNFAKAIEHIEKHINRWREANGTYQGTDFQLLIAGWSPEFGFGQFHIGSRDFMPGMSVLGVDTVWGVFYAGPPIDPEKTAAIVNDDTIKDGAASFGPKLCQLARETPMLNADGGRTFPSVGGHIDLTTLTCDGVETRRLMTWPDRRFRKIDTSLSPVVHGDQLPVGKTAINTAVPKWVEARRQGVAA